MAPKRPPSPSSSSSSSSSSEEEEQQQAVEEESSDDSDSPPKAAAKPSTSKPKEAAVPAAKPPASDSESESESSESSESGAKPPPARRSSRGPDPSIKPIISKPMDGTPQSKKTASSQQGTEKKKRKEPEAAEEEETAGNGVAGKKLFQRVWTEEDEIAVLKGMIQAKNRGDDPESAIDGFLKSIHKSLHSEFSKTQLADKMRRLKKKYETNMRRSKKGADPSFSKPHDQTAFQLSKKIWGGDISRDYGNDDMEVENVKKGGGKKTSHKSVPAPIVTSPRRDDGGSRVVRGSSLVDEGNGEAKSTVLYSKLKDAVALLEGEYVGKSFAALLPEGLDLLKPQTAKALDEKWRKHFMAGLNYFWERSELEKDLLKSLIEALEGA